MSKDSLKKEEVFYIAKLVNLNISDEDAEKLAIMLGETIDYIKVLGELDTKNTPETYQVTGMTNIFQKADTPAQSLSHEDALKNAKEVINGYFATKAVLER